MEDSLHGRGDDVSHQSPDPARILVVKPSSLGDVVHALPTVDRIRRRFPTAHLAWLINTELAPVLDRCPVIDEVIQFPRRDARQLPSLFRRLRAGKFDLVIDLQGLLRSGLVTRATGARRRMGLSDSREGARLFHTEIVAVPVCHAVDRYLHAATHLGCPTTDPVRFPLGLSDDDRAGLNSLVPDGPLIAINPMARWETKIWGESNYARLIDRLAGARVVLIGSASESERINRIADQRDAINLAGQLSLTQVAEVYRRAVAVVSNDTGPMHLAAAVGTPVIALFGPTDPVLVGPYGNGHTVLRAPTGDMTRITVDDVFAALKPFLA